MGTFDIHTLTPLAHDWQWATALSFGGHAAYSPHAEIVQQEHSSHERCAPGNLLYEVALIDDQHQIRASMGYQSAHAATLYLEHYLPLPVEQMIARTLGVEAPARHSVLEVGNLASLSSGGTRGLILSLASHLHQQGYEWLVITATQAVFNSFEKLGIGLELHKLADAHPEAVAHSASDWGSYYQQAPAVYACNFRDSIDQLSSNTLVSKLLSAGIAPAKDEGVRLVAQELLL